MNRLASLSRSLGTILWGALLAALFLTAWGERRVDLWWQLAQGRFILEHHRLPASAPAAFGLPARPFIDEYGLYEIALALLERVGGLGAIHLAFVAVYLAIFLVPLRAARAVRRDGISAGLLVVAGLFLVNRFEQRPEVVGVLLLVLLVALLRRTRTCGRDFLLRLALLFAVWTNVHSSYLIGLAALAIWLADRVWCKEPAGRWKPRQAVLAGVVAAGALLINPYGSGRIAFTFAQENDLGSNLLSREMWPIWHQPPGTIVLLTVTAALLLAVALSRSRPAGWLLVLAGALFFLTVWHFRHMSFLAVPFLFLYADRAPAEPGWAWTPLRVAGLGAGCIAVLLFDALAARNVFNDWTHDEARIDRGFAPRLFDRSDWSGPILCHDAEGSFVSWRAPGVWPLIDSGQGRFDDATKRFYFFTVEDPHAFDEALRLLPGVRDVIVTPPVEGWTLALARNPDWTLLRCDPQGQHFHRLSPQQMAPRPAGLTSVTGQSTGDISRWRDEAGRDGDLVRSFCLSTLIDPPPDALARLDRSSVSAWSEAFFSFVRVWIRSFPPQDLAPFLHSHPHPANALLREILPARPAEPLPPVGPTELEHLARILTLLDRNDFPAAQALFVSLRPPKVSALYYALRDQLDPESARRAPAAARWQDWNSGGEALFRQLGPALDARAREASFGLR